MNADIRGSNLEKAIYDSGIIMAKLQDEVPYNFGRYDMVMLDMEVLKEYDLDGYEKFYNTDKNKEVEMP